MNSREIEIIMDALYIVMDRDLLSESEWYEYRALLKKMEAKYEERN